MRILLIGASSGIGKALAVSLGNAGDQVVLCARRSEELESICSQFPSQFISKHCDVRDEESIKELFSQVHEHFEALDGIIYAPGIASLGHIDSLKNEEWNEMLATNLVGAALVLKHGISQLDAARQNGRSAFFAFLSSHSVGKPWPGLVAYAASKAGLDELGKGLKGEHSWLRVIRFVIGNTATDFANSWDPGAADAALSHWFESGYLNHSVLSSEVVGQEIADALHVPPSILVGMETIRIVGEIQAI